MKLLRYQHSCIHSILGCVIKQTISCEWDKASVLPVIIRLHSHRL